MARAAAPAVLDRHHVQLTYGLYWHQAFMTAIDHEFAAWQADHLPAAIRLDLQTPSPELRITRLAQRFAAFIRATDPTMGDWGEIRELMRLCIDNAAIALARDDAEREVCSEEQLAAIGAAADAASPDSRLPLAHAVVVLWQFLRRMGSDGLDRVGLIEQLQRNGSGIRLSRGRNGERELEPWFREAA